MNTFKEIVAATRPGKIIVAPEPEERFNLLFYRAKQMGFQLIIETSSPERALSSAWRKLEDGAGDMLFQGDIPLGDFFTILYAHGVSRDKLCFVSTFEDNIRQKLLFVADTYFHNLPDLRQKISILEMTIELAKTLGVERPKVAALSALETVNPAIRSGVEAAALAKMGDRQQFDALVEGPLDIDTALSREAAERKGVISPVPGDVDILLCPDIESGYNLSQFITYLGRMPVAGVVLGTEKPIIIHPAFIPPDHKLVEIAIASVRGGKDNG